MKKITTTKLKILGDYNLEKATCKATGEILAAGEGVKIENITGGGFYVSLKYFNDISKHFSTYTQRQKFFITNLFVNGASLTNKGKKAIYRVVFKNGKIVYLNGTTSQIKKYFNVLKLIKSLIECTSFINIASKWESVKVGILPSYAKQLQLYENKISYNPNTKKVL